MTIGKNKTDLLTSALKGFFGTLPCIGSMLSEVICNLIPNQRIDRVTVFLGLLEKRVNNIEQNKLAFHLKSPEFIHLLEDSLIQASRSHTEERLCYIASLLSMGLSEKEIQYNQTKRYLDLLTELTDIEIIILGSFIHKKNKNPEYYQIHNSILNTQEASLNSREKKIEASALQTSYYQHLVQLALLSQKVEMNENTKIPIFSNNGAPKITGYAITILGRKLLSHIDLKSTTTTTITN